jgi:hypothetical protein
MRHNILDNTRYNKLYYEYNHAHSYESNCFNIYIILNKFSDAKLWLYFVKLLSVYFYMPKENTLFYRISCISQSNQQYHNNPHVNIWIWMRYTVSMRVLVHGTLKYLENFTEVSREQYCWVQMQNRKTQCL